MRTSWRALCSSPASESCADVVRRPRTALVGTAPASQAVMRRVRQVGAPNRCERCRRQPREQKSKQKSQCHAMRCARAGLASPSPARPCWSLPVCKRVAGRGMALGRLPSPIQTCLDATARLCLFSSCSAAAVMTIAVASGTACLHTCTAGCCFCRGSVFVVETPLRSYRLWILITGTMC